MNVTINIPTLLSYATVEIAGQSTSTILHFIFSGIHLAIICVVRVMSHTFSLRQT